MKDEVGKMRFIHSFLHSFISFNFVSCHCHFHCHFNSFISTHSCQLSHFNSFISNHSFQFVQVISIHSSFVLSFFQKFLGHGMLFHFIHCIHFISFQFTSFQLTKNSKRQTISYSRILFSKFPPRRVPGTIGTVVDF